MAVVKSAAVNTRVPVSVSLQAPPVSPERHLDSHDGQVFSRRDSHRGLGLGAVSPHPSQWAQSRGPSPKMQLLLSVSLLMGSRVGRAGEAESGRSMVSSNSQVAVGGGPHPGHADAKWQDRMSLSITQVGPLPSRLLAASVASSGKWDGASYALGPS